MSGVTDYSKIKGKGRKEYNVGGGTQKWYICSRSKALTLTRPKTLEDATAATAADYVEITEDITFAVGDGWIPCYATRDTVKLTTESVTERDSSGFPIKAELFVPGMNSEDLGNLQMAANDDVLVLIPTAGGQKLLIGSDQFAAEIKYSFTIGENHKGGRGSKVTIEGFEVGPMIYTGEITEKP